MRRSENLPGLHGDPETVEEAKIALVSSDEDTSLLSCILEVKRIIATSQAELHGCGHIIPMMRQQ